jgi:protein involved in polysaccharide export with SLBB domain
MRVLVPDRVPSAVFRQIKRLIQINVPLKGWAGTAAQSAPPCPTLKKGENSALGIGRWTFCACICGLLAGCSMIETAAPSTNQPAPLSWLTNWVSQPIDMAPGFDVESIRPDPRQATVLAGDLLEVTVWDLYEPGKPYSFPARISQRLTVEVPFLGDVPVERRTIPEVEVLLVESYRKGDYLLSPRILVRSLDPPTLQIQVTGAVNRGGLIELPRTGPSVYAAILSAGGLTRTAGTQVGVTRRSAVAAVSEPEIGNEPSPGPPAVEPAGAPAPEQGHAPALRANSLDELSVPAAAPVQHPPAAAQALFAVADSDRSRAVPPRAEQSAPAHEPEATVWYDVTLARDREQLKRLRLGDGDTVTVRATTPPLRIGGVVIRPGAYPLPPGKSCNVWQAIELAGGVRDDAVPLNITLLRPGADGRNARRWSLTVPSYEQHPFAAPTVEQGDVLHVEPTTGSKIRRAVGDLWNKP